MLDNNANLTADRAKEYLTQEEIEWFNSPDKQASDWFKTKFVAAANLVAAGMQRKAFSELTQKISKASASSDDLGKKLHRLNKILTAATVIGVIATVAMAWPQISALINWLFGSNL